MTNPLEQYLAQYREGNQLTIVGPLAVPQEYADPVVFADGGTSRRRGPEGISVGDGDSHPLPLDVDLDPDKDFSDFAFILEHVPDNFTDIRLSGFLGGRRDHELFNIGEVHHYLASRKSPAKVAFDQRIIGFSRGNWSFTRNGLFSLATIEEAMVTLMGDCSYHCNPAVKFSPLSSLGLSNQGQGTISLECDNPVFVFFEEERDRHPSSPETPASL